MSGDAERARKIEKQGLHVLTTEHTAASGCISRHYIDLNCHLSGNLSHDTKTFYLELNCGAHTLDPESLDDTVRAYSHHLLTDLFPSLRRRQTFCTFCVNSFLRYYTK